MFAGGPDYDPGFAYLGVDGAADSPLVQMLLAPHIVPGTPPGYELCKTIYSYHPLGAVLTDAPITLAQSLPRELNLPVLGEKRILEQFTATWDSISSAGKVGATTVIHNLMKTCRIYGIASLAVGEIGKDPKKPIDLDAVATADLFFNVLDPLNTSGSLVLNQDPNSPDFLKQAMIRVNAQEWHPSRTIAILHEQPLYIEWTSSAFGFVGRSVYQRALYPLKTYLQSMITDQMVTQKAALIVAKMQTPGSFIDNVMQSMFGWKRQQIKSGVSGQVLSIGIEEDVVALDLKNVEPAARFARENVLKNIASACGMPAALINQETLTEGFGEGTEDAKTIVRYLNYVREDMQPAYDFMDKIVQRKAWTKEFWESLHADYPEYRQESYETALHSWMRAFKATWPNLLIEPESEKVKTADVQFKSVIAVVETLGPTLDPESKAKLVEWVADNLNERTELFSSKLSIDTDTLQAFLEENRETQIQSGADEEEPPKPRPFALTA
jgi:hypothetical protein